MLSQNLSRWLPVKSRMEINIVFMLKGSERGIERWIDEQRERMRAQFPSVIFWQMSFISTVCKLVSLSHDIHQGTVDIHYVFVKKRLNFWTIKYFSQYVSMFFLNRFFCIIIIFIFLLGHIFWRIYLFILLFIYCADNNSCDLKVISPILKS